MGTLGTKPVEQAKPAPFERRRAVRQKVHTPAYASFSGTSLALDLSEVLDVSEAGIAIQTAAPLEIGRTLNLCLDLSETRSRIHTPASVVWADRLGRAGIQFPDLPDESRLQLRQWLFHNALAACSNHAGPALETRERSEPDSAAPGIPARPDYSMLLAALTAVRREVETLGADLAAALRLIAERALTFTQAAGAAIALTEGEQMVCHASAGSAAPSLGARFQVGSGFSGECVRTGRLSRCDDSEADPRVDREACRALGIGSMVAVPIRLGQKVIGIIEVFSASPRAFGANEEVVLQRLAETVLAAVNRVARAHLSTPDDTKAEVARPGRPAPAESPLELKDAEFASAPRSHKILLIAAAITILLVVAFLIYPWLRPAGVHRAAASAPRPTTQSKPATAAPSPKTLAQASTINDLHQLAEQGDPYAQFALGARYATGEDAQQDYSEAVRWFTRAADQGHVVAQATLGAYYWAGRGVPQDLGKAYFWSILARAGGDDASKYRVAVLTSRMTRAQVLAAQQQADEWLRRRQPASSEASAIHP
jgi:putative methionine-R-sulfoxide reductase with GAF domain